MNAAIDRPKFSVKGTKIHPFIESNFLVALDLTAGAVEYETKGLCLWLYGKNRNESEWPSMLPRPTFDCFMLQYKFKQFQLFFPYINEAESLKDSGGPW
jgi:hypothetical protein